MRKLLSMLGAMALIGTTSTNVVACGEVPTPTPRKTDLSTIITNNDLKNIYVGQLDKPNKNQILEAIQNNNKPAAKKLTVGDFEFKQGSPTANNATIVGINGHKGEVSLTFTISNFKSINNINGIPINFTIQNIKKINNLIYVSTNGGSVYKSNGTDAFTAMSGTSGAIWSLTVDTSNNIYAGSQNGSVYKSNGTDAFTAMSGTSGAILSLTVDTSNNIYAGSKNGSVYKSNGTDAFTAMSGTSGIISSLTVDTSNNIYAGGRWNNKPTIYLSEKLY